MEYDGNRVPPMESRIGRHQMFMEIAHIVAKRATCLRLNVGAVMVSNRTMVSLGYNGSPSGAPHCSGHLCEGWTTGCRRTIHAEDNALSRVGDATNLDLYVTHSPCSKCYDKMWDSGRVSRIFFGAPFRETDHLVDSLFDCEVYRILPSGHIIKWATGEIVDVPS